MYRRTMRSRAVIPALAAALLLSACAAASRPLPRGYPERQFNTAILDHVRAGIPANSIIALFGPPDTVYEMTFGAKTGRPWDGVAYRYYAARDPLYRYTDEWKRNTFYFYRSPYGLVLNHWVIEHRTRDDGM